MPRTSTSDRDWDAVLRDFRNSGLTHTAFCRLRGISLHTFHRRLYQARRPKVTPPPDRPPTASDSAFLPVTVLADTPPRATSQPLELILPHGRRLAIAPGFDADTLRRLLGVLEAPPCSD